MLLNRLPSSVKFVRKLSSSTNGAKEIKIPVPWGHIAGKWWGPQDQKPIVTFHGWQDNCGSFDRLIPILPAHLSFMTLDFPGHGLSSHIPPGMFYHNANGVMLIRRLQKLFEWPKIRLMGHSLGAITCYTYGTLFPDSVEFCICIDGLNPLINPRRLDRVIETIEKYLKYDEQVEKGGEPPAYSIEHMVEMLHKGTNKSIGKDTCKYLLERNISASEKSPGKFFFRRDPRLKTGPLLNWPMEDILEGARRVTFPLFASKSEQGHIASNVEVFRQVLEILTEKPQFHFHKIPGTHHVHLNEPQVFQSILPDFLDKYCTDDRSMKDLNKIVL